jgi:hypothetical protein
VKRLSMLALLLASSSLVAASAPLPKPQRRAERLARQSGPPLVEFIEDVAVPNLNVVGVAIGAIQAAPRAVRQAPAQPPDADPPG